MKIINEFKEFAMRGNVIDLAVGVIIGAAFNSIVSSLVNDIIMPPIGVVTKGVDFRTLKLTLPSLIAGQPGSTINYGNFIQNLVQFLIIACTVFLLVKTVNKFKRKRPPVAPPAPPELSEEVALLKEIRDVLKKSAASIR